MIRENQKHLNKLLIIIDALTLLISIRLAWYIRFNTSLIAKFEGDYPLKTYFIPLALMVPIYIILYSLFKLYTPYRFKTLLTEFINILKANVVGILLFIMVLYLLKEINYSRYLIFVFFIISSFNTLIERLILRFVLRIIRKKGYNLKHVLFVGFNSITLDFVNKINTNKHWGYKIVGILDDKLLRDSIDKEQLYALEEVAASSDQAKKIIGNIDELDKHLSIPYIDEVFITLPFGKYDKLNWVLELCEKWGVKAQIVPDFPYLVSSRPYIEQIEGIPLISMRYIPLDNFINRVIKRSFDIIVSLVCIILFSPIMISVTLIIKVTSPGPIIFRQERVGLNKKTFNMYKFRSMKIQKESEEKVQWTTANDPRKTKFGSFIRKTSIDELPQLFNVLKGEMSLVGPRPERPFFVDKFKDEIPKYMVKHQVRPGITGWAQVNGWRGDTSIEKRIECDIYYIENWNFGFDIKIMFLTVFKGFVNKNAY